MEYIAILTAVITFILLQITSTVHAKKTFPCGDDFPGKYTRTMTQIKLKSHNRYPSGEAGGGFPWKCDDTQRSRCPKGGQFLYRLTRADLNLVICTKILDKI